MTAEEAHEKVRACFQQHFPGCEVTAAEHLLDSDKAVIYRTVGPGFNPEQTRKFLIQCNEASYLVMVEAEVLRSWGPVIERFLSDSRFVEVVRETKKVLIWKPNDISIVALKRST